MLKILTNVTKWAAAAAIVALGVIIIQMALPPSVAEFKSAWEAGGNQLAYAYLEIAFILCGVLCVSLGGVAVKPQWFGTGTAGFAVQLVICCLVFGSVLEFGANYRVVRYYDSCPGPGPC